MQEAQRELDRAARHTTSLTADMSLAGEFILYAEGNVEALLYAVRVLRGVA